MVDAGTRLSAALAAELNDLDPKQREAATHPGHVVVRAGPGSGKTRTLAARAAYALEVSSELASVACITYTNAAADEVSARVAKLTRGQSTRLVSSTMHSFCLRQIVRPQAALRGLPIPGPGDILEPAEATHLLQECFDDLGIIGAATWRTGAITHIRRAIASDESLDAFDSREVQAARLFDQRLISLGRVDYEAMVLRAIGAVLEDPAILDILRARFPHLLVDEYQDLGGALHRVVTALLDAGLTIFAVGDPDQTIFGFTGADPRYLEELAARPSCHVVDLPMNYRSGTTIVSASEAVLGVTYGRASPEAMGPGLVALHHVDGGLTLHAKRALELAQQSLSQGHVPHRTAILYQQRGVLLDSLLHEASERALDVRVEAESDFPSGPVTDFLRDCAGRASVFSRLKRASGDASDLQTRLSDTGVRTVEELASALAKLWRDAELASAPRHVSLLRSLGAVLDSAAPVDLQQPAPDWLATAVSALRLDELASHHPDKRAASSLAALVSVATTDAWVLQDLVSPSVALGRPLITTYHKAKGREFDVVILPGLVSGSVPPDVRAGKEWVPPKGPALAARRREFYVALSRAVEEAHLIYGDILTMPWGEERLRSPSPFLKPLLTQGH